MSTCTFEVLAYLRERDDLVYGLDIAKAVHQDWSHVLAALCHLKTHNAVDFVQQEGESYWFALPKEMDTRKYVKKGQAFATRNKPAGVPHPRRISHIKRRKS